MEETQSIFKHPQNRKCGRCIALLLGLYGWTQINSHLTQVSLSKVLQFTACRNHVRSLQHKSNCGYNFPRANVRPLKSPRRRTCPTAEYWTIPACNSNKNLRSMEKTDSCSQSQLIETQGSSQSSLAWFIMLWPISNSSPFEKTRHITNDETNKLKGVGLVVRGWLSGSGVGIWGFGPSRVLGSKPPTHYQCL